MESRKIVMRTFSFICLFFIVNLFLMNKIKSLQRFMNLDKQKNLLLIIGSMSITYVFSRIVTYKKYKKRKMFSPHRNHDIHYYFSKLCLQHTKWKKKLFHVITHKKNLSFVLFRFFFDTLIRGERPAVCRRVLTGICLKRFIKLIIIDTRTHSNIWKTKKNTCVFSRFSIFL